MWTENRCSPLGEIGSSNSTGTQDELHIVRHQETGLKEVKARVIFAESGWQCKAIGFAGL